LLATSQAATGLKDEASDYLVRQRGSSIRSCPQRKAEHNIGCGCHHKLGNPGSRSEVEKFLSAGTGARQAVGMKDQDRVAIDSASDDMVIHPSPEQERPTAIAANCGIVRHNKVPFYFDTFEPP